MNREIKFRGKAINGKWVYGDILHSTGYNPPRSIVEIVSVDPDGWVSTTEVDLDTVGQYVDCKDIDGKDVYEGDIVQVGKCKSITGEVVWDDFKKSFTLDFHLEDYESPAPHSLGAWLIGGHTLTILGNIHDNPQLLNQ